MHDGAPTDSTAKNYYVRYRDYIKNVASSEVYSTWPDATLRANILAIMSFTLTVSIRNGIGIKAMILPLHRQRHLTINGYLDGIFFLISQGLSMRCL